MLTYFDSVLLMTCLSLLLYFQMLYSNLSLSLCESLYWHRRCHDALHIRVQPVEGSIQLILRVARSSIVAAVTDIIGGGCSSKNDSVAKQHDLDHHLREYSRGDSARVVALVHHPRPRQLRCLKFHMRLLLSLRYSCCGPMTLPGRTIRSQPMALLDVNPKCFMMWSEMRVPVRPSPDLQCTAMAPSPYSSVMRRNSSAISSGGVVQSSKMRS